MIVVLKPGTSPPELERLTGWLRRQGLEVHSSVGSTRTVLGLVGDTTGLDIGRLQALDMVAEVKRIMEPYQQASRNFHPQDTVIKVGPTAIGGGGLTVIAGPCAVESEEQLCAIAQQVKASGATLLRGGAFKPRTSPYSFQGLQEEGIRLLLKARALTGLPIVSEITDAAQLSLFEQVDVIQVGARNMQNFELLKQLGHYGKPVLLKRGLAATYEDLLLSAEYIMAGGNTQVMLCERGIRTFESYTRNTLDISAIPALHALSHLPVIVDPSHASGRSELVPPLARAAVAAGADGLLIEVHHDPAHALSDGPQALTPAQFERLMRQVEQIHND